MDYYPIVREEDIEGTTEDNKVPSTGVGTGGSEVRQKLYDRMMGLKNKLTYSQAQDKRTNINGGYCDCSGLVWFLYNEIAGINVGTWTGQQVGNGKELSKGSGKIDESVLKTGDLIFFNWGNYNASYDHVEMYMGANQCMGHGGSKPLGPYEKDLTSYASIAHDWMCRSYLDD